MQEKIKTTDTYGQQLVDIVDLAAERGDLVARDDGVDEGEGPDGEEHLDLHGRLLLMSIDSIYAPSLSTHCTVLWEVSRACRPA